MTQTGAIFLDAYRALNAKKMFWLVLGISALVVVSFAFVGINERGLKILFWQIDHHLLNTQFVKPALFYKWIFVNVGIGFWLSWIVTILALGSTAGIFPDLITSGSIDLVVSKPIGRLRLFITQYVAGLLFVTLQVAIFTVASFLVMGFRGGVWEPGLFVAVPLVVCFFSYLFAVCVLLGIQTRSTVAALLLTLGFWFMVYGVGAAEQTLLTLKTMQQEGVTWGPPPHGPPADPQLAAVPPEPSDRAGMGNAATPPGTGDAKSDPSTLEVAHRLLYYVKTVLPKTTETIALLERSLISLAELPENPRNRGNKQADVGREVTETLRGRSVAWVVGTSLGFELVVLAAAAFLFCRRDY